MANPSRRFREIDIVALGIQSGSSRAREGPDGPELPPILAYRNNLTALSRYHNLYFIAYRDQVFVYRPSFPDQTLEEPVIRIVLSTTNSRRAGDLSHRYPHAVNHLTIGDLGDMEVLACACDDGDFIVYFVSKIAKSVRDVESKKGHVKPVLCSLKPYLISNVGGSAWGIAINKTARLLAVSANTHDITIFVCALGENRDDSFEHEFTCDINMPDPLRRRDQILIVGGHATNIPSISIWSDPEDPSRAFLVSTDIGGDIIICDIWGLSSTTRMTLGVYSASSNVVNLHIGWTVACIEAESFRLACNSKEFLGLENIEDKFYDLSPSQPRNSNFGFPLGDIDAISTTSDDMELSTDLPQLDFEDDVDEDEILDEGDDAVVLGAYNSTEPTNAIMQTLNNISAMLIPSPIQPTHPVVLNPNQSSSGGSNPTVASPRQRSRGLNDAEWRRPNNLPFYIFHTNSTDACLLGPPRRGAIAYCNDPCKEPDLPRIMTSPNTNEPYYSGHIKRMCMTQVIPELGVVITATSLGRAAIFTLTRRRYTPSKTESQLSDYAMRLDWVIPFASQEDSRPMHALVGLAVGPVQGREYVEGETRPPASNSGGKRWRIMLTYLDCTVLSYEISRPGDESWVVV